MWLLAGPDPCGSGASDEEFDTDGKRRSVEYEMFAQGFGRWAKVR